MQHDFSDVERWVKAFEDDDRDEWQKPQVVIDLMDIEPGMVVVDLGAGTGYLLPYLDRATGPEGKVLALDPEPNLVEFMQKRIEREALATVEARTIPFDDPEIEAGVAHRVLIVNTWHHIGDREVYSAKLREALAPGGAVYVVDFTKESPRGPSVDHRLPPERVIEEMSAGGLQASLVEEGLPWQYVVVGRRPGS